MRAKVIAGIVLLVLGVLALVYQGVSYTTREEVADIGPLEVETEETETIPLPPIIGGIAVLGGIALILLGSRDPDRGRV